MKKAKQTIIQSFLFLSCLAAPAYAEYVADADPNAAGDQPGSVYQPVAGPAGSSSISEGWEQLTAAAYPGNGVGFPGTGAWPAPLESHAGDDAGTNGIDKTANGYLGLGGPYPASSSIYCGGLLSVPNTDGGELTIEASGDGLLANLKTVVFQVDIGEAWTYDFYQGQAPQLTYTVGGVDYTISASFSSLYSEFFNGTVIMPPVTGEEEDLNINSWAFQFDLSGVTGTITSFSISFHPVQHSSVYGAGLQQFDAASATSLLP